MKTYDWTDAPGNAEYFELLPAKTLFDFGGGGGGGGYGQAAAIQAAAGERSANNEMNFYNQMRADLMPGITAYGRTEPYIGGLLGIPGYDKVDPTQALRSTPGYQFTMDQGTDALGRYAAARGMSMSGPQMKGLQTYGQGMADKTYQQYLGNLMGYASGGQQAAGTLGGAGMHAADQMGQDYRYGADAQANAILAQQAQQAQQRQSGYGSLMSGLGVLGGIAMAPMTGGTSLIGSAMSGLGGLFGGGGGGGYGGGGGSGSSLYGYSNAYNPGMNMQW